MVLRMRDKYLLIITWVYITHLLVDFLKKKCQRTGFGYIIITVLKSYETIKESAKEIELLIPS
jgi:hypothetical protein